MALKLDLDPQAANSNRILAEVIAEREDRYMLSLYKAGMAAGEVYAKKIVETDQLEALIPCMRQSAQGTLEALHRNGWKIVRS